MTLFRVDTGQSKVDIDLKVNLHPSHITATGLTGTIECELDEEGRPRLDRPYTADLVLPVSAISSGHGLQDREMRRRFDSSRYPVIEAKVTRGEAINGHDGRYRATAQLSMHGHTKELSGEVALQVTGDTMTVDGEHVINVKDYGIEPPRLIILKVEPDVDLRAHIVAKQAQ
jgi:polyisoprenoid-binding protein YceI